MIFHGPGETGNLMIPSNARYFQDRVEWREWLEENHDTETEIWLIYYKKHTGVKRIPYDDAVEEAICFGWIDSIVKRIDDERYMQKFTPRKDRSSWSELNRKRAELMIAEGLMTGAGMSKVRAARENGLWEKKPVKKEGLTVPPDLEKALFDAGAQENFGNMPPSSRKHYIGWIESAKREETRRKRIEESVSLIRQNKRLGMK